MVLVRSNSTSSTKRIDRNRSLTTQIAVRRKRGKDRTVKRSPMKRGPKKEKLNADWTPREKPPAKPKKRRTRKDVGALPYVQPFASIVKEECLEYRESRSEHVCEVSTYLKRDQAAYEWITSSYSASMVNRQTQVHHIWGRGRSPELNWFCSLILIHGASHSYGHDVNPYALEICSIVAKWELERTLIAKEEIFGVKPIDTQWSRRHWHIPSMDAAVKAGTGCVSLSGRIDGILLPGVVGTVWHAMGVRLLGIIERDSAK